MVRIDECLNAGFMSLAKSSKRHATGERLKRAAGVCLSLGRTVGNTAHSGQRYPPSTPILPVRKQQEARPASKVSHKDRETFDARLARKERTGSGQHPKSLIKTERLSMHARPQRTKGGQATIMNQSKSLLDSSWSPGQKRKAEEKILNAMARLVPVFVFQGFYRWPIRRLIGHRVSLVAVFIFFASGRQARPHGGLHNACIM